jgi:hypothetical protein
MLTLALPSAQATYIFITFFRTETTHYTTKENYQKKSLYTVDLLTRGKFILNNHYNYFTWPKCAEHNKFVQGGLLYIAFPFSQHSMAIK